MIITISNRRSLTKAWLMRQESLNILITIMAINYNHHHHHQDHIQMNMVSKESQLLEIKMDTLQDLGGFYQTLNFMVINNRGKRRRKKKRINFKRHLTIGLYLRHLGIHLLKEVGISSQDRILKLIIKLI